MEEYADDGSVTTRRLAIDPRRTVREEMEALFHAARRGRRGLDHVARRRKELEAELARLQQDRRGILAGSLPDPRLAAPAPTEQAARLPRNVQLFISSDGEREISLPVGGELRAGLSQKSVKLITFNGTDQFDAIDKKLRGR